MSLIQEALKRQQQENNEQSEPTSESPQPTPPPPPPEVVPQQTKQPNLNAAPEDSPVKEKQPAPSPAKKPMNLVNRAPTAAPAHAIEPKQPDHKKKSNNSPWKKLIIALIILFIIIAAAVVMIFLALKKLAGEQLNQGFAQYIEEAESIITVAPETVKPAAVEPKIVKPATPEIIKTAAVEPETKVKTLIHKIIKKHPKQVTKTAPTRKPVKWPQLKITATLVKGSAGQAIINGKFITVGEKIDGVTLVKVLGSSAEFSYKNEKKILKVGNSVQLK